VDSGILYGKISWGTFFFFGRSRERELFFRDLRDGENFKDGKSRQRSSGGTPLFFTMAESRYPKGLPCFLRKEVL
jgi:hypothetical protein